MLNSFDHLIFAVRELEPAIGALARLLGRRPSWRGEHPGYATENALFKLDNTYIELLAPAAAPAPEGAAGRVRAQLAAHFAAHGEGLFGAVLGAPNADQCARELAARGFHPVPPQAGFGRDVESGAFRKWRAVFLPPEELRGYMLFAIQHESPPEILPPAAPLNAACADAAVHALDHVVVQTQAPDAARAFYRDKLGIRLALEREAPQWGGRMMFFRIGGVTLEVVARNNAAAAAANAGAAEDRLWGVAWRVASAQAAHARMQAAGIPVSEVREGRKPGTRVFTVKGESCGAPTLVLEDPQRPPPVRAC